MTWRGKHGIHPHMDLSDGMHIYNLTNVTAKLSDLETYLIGL